MKKANRFLYGVVITAMAALLNGCIEKDPELKISQVLMVPLSPNSPAVDFVINGTRQAVTVGYSSSAGTITYTLPYYTVQAGNAEISYNANGSTTKLASISTELGEDQAYSTFLIDSANKLKLAMVSDDVSEPTPGKVKIRFFHFSPNAPAVDVAVVATGANLFTNRTFNDQGGNTALQRFIEIDPGNYAFQFKLAGTATVAYTTSALTLLPDRIYTLAARGFVGGAGNQALGGWLYPNKAQ